MPLVSAGCCMLAEGSSCGDTSGEGDELRLAPGLDMCVWLLNCGEVTTPARRLRSSSGATCACIDVLADERFVPLSERLSVVGVMTRWRRWEPWPLKPAISSPDTGMAGGWL